MKVYRRHRLHQEPACDQDVAVVISDILIPGGWNRLGRVVRVDTGHGRPST